MKEEIKNLWKEYRNFCKNRNRWTSLHGFLEWIIDEEASLNP